MILPKELAKTLQPKRLLLETEWRALGVQQSRGWAHYAIHRCARARLRRPPLAGRPHAHAHTRAPARSPEPHILLFRRELGTDPMTGKVRGAEPPPRYRALVAHAPPLLLSPQVNPALRAQAIEQFNREAAAAQ